jgi:hypothetical protein
MKLKYLLILFGLVLLMSFDTYGQKVDPRLSIIRADSIIGKLMLFGKSADLFNDPYMEQRRGTSILANEEGTRIFLGLFANLNDTCIVNYLDPARKDKISVNKAGRGYDSIPVSELRYQPVLTPSEYVKLLNFLYTSEGSSSEITTNSIKVFGETDRRNFGKKYKIEATADFSFSGQNDSIESLYVFDDKSLWFSFSYEKFTIKNEVVLRNFKITKIQLKPISQPGDTALPPPIGQELRFSVEPWINVGFTGAKHTYNEILEGYLSSKVGKVVDLGVNFSYPVIQSEDSTCLDLGLGVGYSMITLPITLTNYPFTNTGLAPPFQPSAFFKEYDYTMKADLVDESHMLGFVNIPLFARLRIPVKHEMEAFFKLGVQTLVPIHAGYRTDGEIKYTGEFHYVVNNKETVITTDQPDANLESSIPNFSSLYGVKKSISSEKLNKSFGVTSKFETGVSFRANEKIKYYLGAYVSYRISGLTYGSDSELIGQEGRINSFLTKTDKVNPFGFGLTFSASIDVLTDRFKKNK